MPGNKRRRIRPLHKAHLRQQIAEDNDEHDRLHDRAQKEIRQFALGDAHIPPEEGDEDSRCPDRPRHQSSLLPVNDRNNVSRLGAASVMLVIRAARRSARCR